jgi:hypothetical protein
MHVGQVTKEQRQQERNATKDFSGTNGHPARESPETVTITDRTRKSQGSTKNNES